LISVVFIASPSFAANDLLRLHCLVASAAFGVQEAEEFLQGVGIGGVPKKCAFTPNLNKLFVL